MKVALVTDLHFAFKKGNDVYLEAGQPVDIILDQPLTVGGGQAQSGYDNY